jgi:tetraacyldisaccharide-1-P 4'-kinase
LSRLATTAHNTAAAGLITSDKDHVRLGNLACAFPEFLPLQTARLRIEIEDKRAAIDWLIGRLRPAPHPPL